jgi:hypothetical protein
MFENRVPRRELTGGCRNFHEELHKLNASPSAVWVAKSRRMWYVGYVLAYMGEMRNTNKILVGKPTRKSDALATDLPDGFCKSRSFTFL